MATARFPEAERRTVPVVPEGEAVGRAGGDRGPVAASAAGADGEELQVDVLDRGVAERLGVSGFVFGVSDVEPDSGGGLLERAAGGSGLAAQLAVDFSGFADAYGSGFADRLEVRALPRCALEDPVPDGCNTAGVELPTRVDLTVEELVVDVEDLAGLASEGARREPAGELGLSDEELARVDRGSDEVVSEGEDEYLDVPAEDAADEDVDVRAERRPDDADEVEAEASELAASSEPMAVFAVTSGPSGETGNFGATPLELSGDWQVAPGSGNFSYSYDVEVPTAASGARPRVGLSYSSGSVDGLTTGNNTQSPQAGVGWGDFSNAFVERRYEPCTATVGTSDLCWSKHNATISLNGVSGRLIPTDSSMNQWRVQGDPGWRVARLSGAANDDNDGEYWRVTTTDGTQYYFGLGRTLENTITRSVNWAPVLADHAGEPCRGGGDTLGGCDQGWRWNLDRVVDPNGNVTQYGYYRDLNMYSALGGWAGDDQYVRNSRLQWARYGAHVNSPQTTVHVTFGAEHRCTSLNSTCTGPHSGSDPAVYPDVPVDLLCTSDCNVTTPTFFSTVRYSYVRTEVRVGTALEAADTYNLGHSFIANTDGDRKLYLTSVQRIGQSTGVNANHPPTTFWYWEHANRVDVNLSEGERPMGHFRLGIIANEYGGQTWVGYGQNRPCTATYAVAWDENVRDCFPGGPGAYIGSPITDDGLFNKWLVTEVTEAPGHGSPNVVTSYSYEGDPAWHFTYDPFIARNQFGQTVYGNWNGWRGYGTATATQGASRSRTRVFRGMDGDWTLGYYAPGDWHVPVGDPARQEQVTTFDGAQSFTDSPAMAGRVLEEQALGTLQGTPNVALESTRYTYAQQVTAVVTDGEAALDDAAWSDVATVTDTIATSPTASTQTRTQYGYNANFQRSTTFEEGRLGQAGDERCSITTYADRPNSWMYTYPASITSVAGNCQSTNQLSVSETYYDNSTTLGALPGPGNATRSRARLDATTWTETTSTYDQLGRTLSVTDANGSTTTTAYTASPAHAVPTQTTVTNDLGHVTTTQWVPEYSLPQREDDPNGNVTSWGYDGFGRLDRVRLPTEQPYASGKPYSSRYAYLIDPNRTAAPVVRTERLTSEATSGPDVVLEDSWEVYDGLLRPRQAQSLSPTAGRVIASTTTYDDRGQVQDVTAPQAITGTAGAGILTTDWANRTRTAYDELGRTTSQQWWRNLDVQHETTFAYTADTVTTTPPEGGQVREVSDGLGRTISVGEHDGTDWRSTTYAYDLADRLTAVTDPAGNTTTYTYNMAGWRLTTDDPDRGASSVGYDPAGNPVRSTDANGAQVHTILDPLGRPAERRANSVTGPLLASWDYDATGQLGLLDSVTRHHQTGNWVSDVTGYDGRDRPLGTTLTVPAGIPGLTGSYTVSQAYDAADRAVSVTYPAVGGLPSEEVTTTYNALSLPTELTGAQDYVSNVAYDDRGRPTTAAYGPQPGGQPWMASTWGYDADQRLASTETWVATASAPGGVVSSHEFGYDDNGNITNRATSLNGDSWRECYTYDARQRLVEAHTVAEADNCATGTPGGGDQPYQHAFTYSPDGNLTQRIEDGATTGYTYPAAGADRPHAPTNIGGDAHTWGPNGNLTQRIVDGVTETFAWDIEQMLASVTAPTGTTSFVYDAGGDRLLRRGPGGATLYFAGHEVHANANGSTVMAVRSYAFAGGAVATRTPQGVGFLGADQAGSAELQVAADADVTASRSYDPYGAVRSESGELDTDRGFVGQVEDPTGLSYLNARYYDTTNGIFISADPLYDLDRPKSQNPYAYAHGNPATLSDPSGLRVPVSNSSRGGNFGWDARVNGGRGGFIGSARSDPGITRAQARRFTTIQTQQRNEYRQVVVDNRQRRHNAALSAMCQANCNPSFWQALAGAGSGDGLVLRGLQAANPDPGFWRFLAAAGSPENANRIAQEIAHQARLEALQTARANLLANFFDEPGGVGGGSGSGGGSGGAWGGDPSDCARDEISWACAGQVLNNVEVTANFCAGLCLGSGVQGGALFLQDGIGCCWIGGGAGAAPRDYSDRACSSWVVTGGAGPSYYAESGSYGNYWRPSADLGGGVGIGLGFGGGFLSNHDIPGSNGTCSWFD